MRRIFVLTGLSLSLLSSCKNQPVRSDGYFDSLVSEQVTALNKSEARLIKISKLGNKSDSIVIKPDEQQWEKELSVFRLLNSYEKPAYKSSYSITDNVNDPNSNLLIKSYFSARHVPVPELHFFYFHNIQRLKRIEGVYLEKNFLFSTSRKLVIEFGDQAGKPQIVHYSIEGKQKMAGSDSVTYLVSATIKN
jgi:hypothetical protein